MNRTQMIKEIRHSWRDLFEPDGCGRGIVCPICGSGSGAHGTGIVENPNAKQAGSLKCFACGFSGDALDLMQQRDESSLEDAIKRATDDLGLEYVPDDPAERARADFKDEDEETPTKEKPLPKSASQRAENVSDYSDFYRECAARLSDPAAQDYLRQRGISTETAIAYGLGYAPEWISPTAIKRQQAKGSEWQPPASPRLILPITKNHYLARATDPESKYPKQNETGGGEVGIFNAQSLFSGNETVFVVEGVLDALSIIEAGADALALNTTTTTDKLIEILREKPTTATLILCLDNDAAGRKASEKLRQGCARYNISTITADICNGAKDPNEALTRDREAFIAAIERAQAMNAARPDGVAAYIRDILPGEIEELAKADECKTGFEYLDEISGGLYPGLYVVGAVSSLGKTSFMLQVADNMAAAGHEVLFFSMEQSRLELVTKSIARYANRDWHYIEPITSLAIRKGAYLQRNDQEGAEARETITAATKEYAEAVEDRMNIIEGNFDFNLGNVADYIRRYIARNECRPVVIVDYLQILQPEADTGNGSGAKEIVDHAIGELKKMSRELKITVFVISSLNRANYSNQIDFESFKESGAIEYTADCVWGLQLEILNNPDFQKAKPNKRRKLLQQAKAADNGSPRQIELVCLKNRFGISSYSTYFDYYPAEDTFTNQKYKGTGLHQRMTPGYEFSEDEDDIETI